MAINRTQLRLVGCPRLPCLIPVGLNLVLGLHLVRLSLNRSSDILCDFMSGESVLVTFILAQKHILHILEGEVWFRRLFG